jgi:tRNA A-37 threonylcarbamoyl transferase component Bud32
MTAENIVAVDEADEALLLPESTTPTAADSPNHDAVAILIDVDEEIEIAYRPFAGAEKWLKYRFSAWSEAKAWFVMTLIAVFVFMGGPGKLVAWLAVWLAEHLGQGEAGTAAAIAVASQAVLYYFFAGFGGLLALTACAYYAQPTHIGISRYGIRHLLKRKFVNLVGPLVEWQKVKHIQLLRPPGKTSPQDWLVCFNSAAGPLMKLKLGAIAKTDERAELLNAIDKFAADKTRDSDLVELLTPAHDHSYTELWLKALSAPPKRERLTPLLEGVRLKEGRFEVLGQLGVGGQGTAYLALDRDAKTAGESPECRVDRQAASDSAGSTGPDSRIVLKESILPVYVDVNVRREALERFQNEALMLSKLDHPQIVKLRDYFVEDHRSYLVLEHIDGMSLRQLVSGQGCLSEEAVHGLAVQMCEILSYLHELAPPVVHRDFTPDNLILNSRGKLKLVDFNVAQQTEFTTTGTVVGKHAYIPPEQFRGKPTPQSDIYALGATLFYLLTAEDPEPISQSHPILKRDDITARLDKIVASATAIDTKQRYQSIQALMSELSIQEEESRAAQDS